MLQQNNVNWIVPSGQYIARAVLQRPDGSFVFEQVDPSTNFVYRTYQEIKVAAVTHAATYGLRFQSAYASRTEPRIVLLFLPISRQPFVFDANAPAFVPRAQPAVVLSIEEIVDTEQSEDVGGNAAEQPNEEIVSTGPSEERIPEDVETTEAEQDDSEKGAEEVESEADGRYYPGRSLENCASRLAKLDLNTLSKDCPKLCDNESVAEDEPSTSDLQGPSSSLDQPLVVRTKKEKRKDKKDKKKARKEKKKKEVVEKEEMVDMPREKELMKLEDLKIKRLEKCSSETTFCKNHQGNLQIVKISVTVRNSNSWKTAKLCQECINQKDCPIGSRWPEEVWTLLMEVKHVHYHGDFTKYTEEEIDEFLNKEVISIPLANPEYYRKILSCYNGFLLSEINWFQYKKNFKTCNCGGPVNIRIVGVSGPCLYKDFWFCDTCAIEMFSRPERLLLPIPVWESLDIAKLMKMHEIRLIDRVQASKLCMNEALHFIDSQSRAKIYKTFCLFLHAPIDLTLYDLYEGDDVSRMERRLSYDTDRLKWDITSRFVSDDDAKSIVIRFMMELRIHETENKKLDDALKHLIDVWKFEHKQLVTYSVINPEYRTMFFKYVYALFEKSGLSQESLPEFSTFLLF